MQEGIDHVGKIETATTASVTTTTTTTAATALTTATTTETAKSTPIHRVCSSGDSSDNVNISNEKRSKIDATRTHMGISLRNKKQKQKHGQKQNREHMSSIHTVAVVRVIKILRQRCCS